MKIIYLSSSTIPSKSANSIHVMKMCAAFAANNHNVILVAPNKKTDELLTLSDIYKRYGIQNKFKLKKISWLPINGRGYIYGFMAAIYSKFQNPDIVYGRNLSACAFSSFLGLKTAFEVHDTIDNKGSFEKWLFKKMLSKPNFLGLFSITHALKAHYVSEYNLSPDKVFVVPDGADLVNYNQANHDATNFSVGYVGSFYKGKGVEQIISIAQMMPETIFNLYGGDTEQIESMQNYAPKNVIFNGYIEHSKINDAIRPITVMLLPNQRQVQVFGGGGDIAKWTSPLKAFEYMAAGKAIIASNLDVLKEVLHDGENALLCDPENIEEWVSAIKRLEDNQDLCQILATNARADFEANYTWQKRAKNIVGFCRK